MKKLNQPFDFYKNGFDVIRLFAALAVLFLHTFGNFEVNRPLIFTPFYFLDGVVILFAVSGFLIPASLERMQYKRKEFILKRVARIYPALYVAVTLSTIFIFVFYAVPGVKDAVIYFATQYSFCQFFTGDWLREYGVGAPNGALWTIVVELQFYIFAAVFYPILKKQKKSVWGCCIALSIALTWICSYILKFFPAVIGKLYGEFIIQYLPIFLISMFLYCFREELINILLKYYWIVLGGYVVLSACRSYFDFFLFYRMGRAVELGNGFGLIDFALVILTIATAYKTGKIRFKIDFSYSIYLFHMIFINLAVEFGYGNNWWAVLAVWGTSVAVAFISTVFIEKPIIKKMDLWIKKHFLLEKEKRAL